MLTNLFSSHQRLEVLSVKPDTKKTFSSMDIQSVINIIEYLNVSKLVNKQKRKVTVSEYGTINLYKARLLYLGVGDPPLRSLLIKGDILQKSIFGPPRQILK